jgi:hypothetical protein
MKIGDVDIGRISNVPERINYLGSPFRPLDDRDVSTHVRSSG